MKPTMNRHCSIIVLHVLCLLISTSCTIHVEQADGSMKQVWPKPAPTPQPFATGPSEDQIATTSSNVPGHTRSADQPGSRRTTEKTPAVAGTPQKRIESETPERMKQAQIGAEAGMPMAQFYVSLGHYLGRELPKDHAKSAMWAKRAAEQGYADAQHHLGHLHEKGEGVPQNYGEAMKWYRKAAEQGNADSQERLSALISEGRARGLKVESIGKVNPAVTLPRQLEKSQETQKEGAVWARKAAEQGDASAQYQLGFRYLAGQGLPESEIEACAWWQIAKENGSASARRELPSLLAHLSAEDRAAAGRRAAELKAKMTAR